MQNFDLQQIKQAVNDGRLKIWVNKYGHIIMLDTVTGERAALTYVGD